MASFLRRWRWRHLFAAWIAYWAGLAVVTLWRPIGLARRLSQLPDGQGTISAELSNAQFTARMVERGAEIWSVSTSLLTIGLWIAGPPLVLWGVWAMGRSRPHGVADTGASLGGATSSGATPGLGEGITFADHLTARPAARGEAHVPRERGGR